MTHVDGRLIREDHQNFAPKQIFGGDRLRPLPARGHHGPGATAEGPQEPDEPYQMRVAGMEGVALSWPRGQGDNFRTPRIQGFILSKKSAHNRSVSWKRAAPKGLSEEEETAKSELMAPSG
jgi:hypothetical protein